jgi:Chalcone isomerase-like
VKPARPTARRTLLLLGAAWLSGAPLHAQQQPVPPEVAAALPGARLVGQGRLRFMGLRIYDARLWVAAQAPGSDWVAVPWALELAYARDLKGEQIAERSLVEMRRQGDIAPETATRWLGQMKQLFPDVKDGDRITGINLPGTGARFHHNGNLRGEVADVEFARWFFGIWLSPRSSEPALRDALLGRTS